MDSTWFVDPLFLFGLLQPTVWLLAALLVSLSSPRRPARAHALVFLALVGLLLTPAATLVWRGLGWGILSPGTATSDEPSAAAASLVKRQPPLPGLTRRREDVGVGLVPVRQPSGETGGQVLSGKAIARPADDPRFAGWHGAADWRRAAWVLWGLTSVALALRTVAGAWRARRLLRRIGTQDDPRLQACLDESSVQLGLRRAPLLAVADVGVPVIWCWGRQPLILVPSDATAKVGEIDWVGVFRHELAHWKRRDHLTQAIARLATIVVPFHPFVWFAARRLNVLSERACDAWAVADGRSPLDYAESLLRLCPQRAPRMALAAVSGRKPLVARVRRLVNHRAAPPDTGTRWLAGRAGCTIVACAVLALAQPRAESSPDSQPASSGPAETDGAKMTVTGRVLLPGDRPAAGAQVAITGHRRKPSRGGDFSDDDPEILALAVADESGNFSVESPRTSSTAFWDVYALAALDGYARGLTPLDCDAQSPSVVLHLAADQALTAMLIDVQGEPASGVEFFVQAIGFERPGQIKGVRFFSFPERFALWPRRMKSDQRGRLVLNGFSRPSVVEIVIDDPRFAQQVIVLGGDDDTKEPTISLPPSQIIEGTVTYGDTGAVVPRARLTVYARQNEFAGGSGVAATTDERGHFRISPFPGAYMEIRAYAPDGAPYLATLKSVAWPKGAATLQTDMVLPRGVLARGKVVTEKTGVPLAEAGIEYEPMSRNPNNQASLVFGWKNMTLTDARGEFALAVPSGEGHLLIKGPSGDFVHQEIGRQVLLNGQPGGQRYYPDAVIPLDIPKNKESVDVEARLRRAVVVKGRLVGPEGQAVHRALMICRLQLPAIEFSWRFPTEIVDGNFELHGLDPQESYPVMFLDAENQWGVTTTLSGRQAGAPLTVQLQPCGSASGRFVGTNGKPLRNFRPTLELVVTPGVAKYNFPSQEKGALAADSELIGNIDRVHYWPGPETNEEGRIVLPALIPGATYASCATRKPEPNSPRRAAKALSCPT